MTLYFARDFIYVNVYYASQCCIHNYLFYDLDVYESLCGLKTIRVYVTSKMNRCDSYKVRVSVIAFNKNGTKRVFFFNLHAPERSMQTFYLETYAFWWFC